MFGHAGGDLAAGFGGASDREWGRNGWRARVMRGGMVRRAVEPAPKGRAGEGRCSSKGSTGRIRNTSPVYGEGRRSDRTRSSCTTDWSWPEGRMQRQDNRRHGGKGTGQSGPSQEARVWPIRIVDSTLPTGHMLKCRRSSRRKRECEHTPKACQYWVISRCRLTSPFAPVRYRVKYLSRP